MGKALDAEEILHVCFKIITSMMSAKHFKCDLFHFRDLFKIRYRISPLLSPPALVTAAMMNEIEN